MAEDWDSKKEWDNYARERGLDLKRWQWLFLAGVIIFLAWFIPTFAPKSRPENHQQLARYAADCFEKGGSEYSVRGGCK